MEISPRVWVGLALAGYGALVLVRVLAHEAPLAGAISLGLGLTLLVPGLPRLELRRARVVAAVGAVLAGGVLSYNLATRSGLGAPEFAMVLYGAALLALAPFLSSRLFHLEVGTIVGWSFPLLLAPLLLFALNGVFSSPASGAAASPLVIALLVLPTAAALRLSGTPVEVFQNNLILETERGSLTLGVGLICAGIYPMVLFGALLALHAWRTSIPPRRFVGLLACGLLGLWIMNLVRLVALAKVGGAYGVSMLQDVHANLGWVLFLLFMGVFWAVVHRRWDAVPARSPST